MDEKKFMRCIMCGGETTMPEAEGVDSVSCSECEKIYSKEQILKKVSELIKAKRGS